MGNIEELDSRKMEAKNLLNNFGERHKEFFGLRDKNKDPHNTKFLINYDIISIPYLWSEQMTQLGRNIINNMLDYKTREESKDKEIFKNVYLLIHVMLVPFLIHFVIIIIIELIKKE